MKQFYTVVLDRMTSFNGRLDSEPYEAGWADEVIAYVRVHTIEPNANFSAKLQISPDGINWVDEGASIDSVDEDCVSFMKATHFGGWLRICATCTASCKITTYLALKG